MTIRRLHKLLGTAIKKGSGNFRLCIDKATFSHPLESYGALVLDVMGFELAAVPVIDDGGMVTLADGRQKEILSLVFYGNAKKIKGAKKK